MEPDITIVLAGAERISDIEPLFVALNEHQVRVAPTLAGLRPRPAGDAWGRRRARYETWLSEPGAFLLIAEQDSRPIGYAVVSLGEGYDGWHSPERVGEVHDFAVLPDMRGRGVGTMLMNAVEHEFLAADAEYCRLRVIAQNVDAVRFYEQRGMVVVSHIMLGRISTRASREQEAR